ncbi:hypothetical protein L5515_002399 [Caenorhabditis briggsae]|uniref:Uncharacterized protein n=1 Tax=Caenorhabditis briggsae TaxID=6238 RepID=A0AAE9E6D0_CAEBR|nr:hypothetical protein L5515_002399 [Caenorhabditis briggsae]
MKRTVLLISSFAIDYIMMLVGKFLFPVFQTLVPIFLHPEHFFAPHFQTCGCCGSLEAPQLTQGHLTPAKIRPVSASRSSPDESPPPRPPSDISVARDNPIATSTSSLVFADKRSSAFR